MSVICGYVVAPTLEIDPRLLVFIFTSSSSQCCGYSIFVSHLKCFAVNSTEQGQIMQQCRCKYLQRDGEIDVGRSVRLSITKVLGRPDSYEM